MNRIARKSSLIIRMCLVLALLGISNIAKAESDASSAKRSLKTIRTEVRKLRKIINRGGVRSALVKTAVSYKELRDGDSDGLPDVLENVEGTDSCGNDSDNDGISDGDEDRAGSKPGDSTSSEVELKNTISAITESTVTVGSYTFTLTNTTRFEAGVTFGSFKVGDFVEASGRLSAGVLLLKKLKLEN